jgi:hypothetical protein
MPRSGPTSRAGSRSSGTAEAPGDGLRGGVR